MEDVKQFNREVDFMFDIFCENTDASKQLEKYHGVTMTDNEWEFLVDEHKDREIKCFVRISSIKSS